jgi:hypothetical protein
MLKKLLLGTAMAAVLFPSALRAEHHEKADMEMDAVLYVQGAYVKTPANGAEAAAGLMTIYNNSADDNAVVAVESDMAEAVELHTMEMDGDIMKMTKVDEIIVPANGHAELSMETGDHLMFINPESQWEAGDVVEATITFKNGATLDVELPVMDMEDAGEMHDEMHDDAHHHDKGHDAMDDEAHNDVEIHMEHEIENGAEEDSAVDIEKEHHGEGH